MYQLENEIANLEIDNPNIIAFLNFLPLSTFDDFPMTYRYYANAIYHYKNAEYELSIFSFYLLYIHILHCFILKQRCFQLNEIQKDFEKSHKEKTPNTVNPFAYSIKLDRNKIKLLNRNDLKEKHVEIVDMRNDIHDISIIKRPREMELFLDKILFVLNSLYQPIINDLTQKMNLIYEFQQDDNNVIEDFLLSLTELEFLKKQCFSSV